MAQTEQGQDLLLLGTANGKSDRVAYRRALAKWNTLKAQIDQTERQIAMEERRQELHDLSQRLRRLPRRIRRRLHAVDPTPLPRLEGSRNGGGRKLRKTVNELMGLFLKAQEQRYQRGREFPNAPPRKERISASRLMAIRFHTKTIRAAMGTRRLNDDEAEIAQMMRDFRSEHDALVLDGTIKPNTFNERIKDLRQFIGWCHTHYYISTLPKNLPDLCSKYQYEPSPKAIGTKTTKRLWTAATLRDKCWIALGLNLGYYACDIATLESDHIQGNHIVRKRHKTRDTGWATRHKLWSVTKQPITKCRSANDGPIFAAMTGNPLQKYKVKLNSRTDVVAAEFARTRDRAKVTGVKFSNLQDTSATHIEQIDPAPTDIFLGHKDRRMARYYIDGRMTDSSRLDAAIDQLEKIHQLSLDD